MNKFILTLASLAYVGTLIYAQSPNVVTVDPYVQRYVGDVSELDRSKYFNLHTTSDNDPDIQKFLDDYDVGMGRGFHGPFSNAFSKTKEAGVYPEAASYSNKSRRPVKRYVATEHPNSNILKWGMDPVAAGAWAAEYYNNFSGEFIPEFFEPLNEPFVHSYSDRFPEAPDAQDMKRLMADLFAESAKHIHANPALRDMKVIGYASAYPAMEIRDFKHWNDNMKLFLDRAGEHVDGVSVHLYDGINVRGKASRRSGSNSEAILDMVEGYSFIKFGKVIPHATSEYGGIDDTYGIDFDERNSYRVMSSINHIMFNLMERQDKMLISIPFICDKSTWYIKEENDFKSYCAVLMTPTNPSDFRNSEWIYNDKIHFFDLWKDVKGDRVEFSTNNPDIQVQAFRDGKKLFVALDNLDDYTQEVGLPNSDEWGDVKSVTLRSFKVGFDSGITYSETTSREVPQSVALDKDETMVMVVELKRNSKFEKSIRREKYYSNTYLQPIEANKLISFTIDNVESGSGYAVARMSIGRKLDMSKAPKIEVNGVEVDMPLNWRGYDQAGRDDFFGTMEIPFDLSIVKEGTNNITVTFPDSGGHVSTMILSVERYF